MPGENRYYALFGVEENPTPTAVDGDAEAMRQEMGSTAQEVGEGSASEQRSSAESASVSQPAEGQPAESAEGTEAGAEEAPEGSTQGASPTATQQTATREQPEVSARQQEASAIAQLRTQMEEQHRQRVEQMLSVLGLRDPNNGNAQVKTVEDFAKYEEGLRSAKLQRDLKAGRLTPETLGEAVRQTPEIREILNQAQATKQAAEAAQAEANRKAFEAKRAADMAEIRKLNPAIQSLDDIVRMETGPAFAGYLRKGLDAVDAYKLANHDALIRSSRSAGEQAARNAAAGKGHLRQTPGSIGMAPVAVSEKTKATYRRFNPGMSDAEISAAEQALRKK